MLELMRCIAFLFLPTVASSAAGLADENASFAELLHRAQHLPYSVPTIDNTLQSVAHGDPAREQRIQRFAAETHPFLHARTWALAADFLAYKLQHGSAIEQRLYKGMGVQRFITRLLSH